MNRRKLLRAKSHNKALLTDISEQMNMNKKAQDTIKLAISGEDSIDCIGNFIFLSTPSGEAWLLDHREGLALRLADGFLPLPYRIVENKKTFQIDWTEKFFIEDGTFIAVRGDKQSNFFNYPIEELQDLIGRLRA